MATKVSEFQSIQVAPGFQPSTDRTAFSTPHYTAADKVRCFRGIPQKIGGWRSFPFLSGATISGIARSLFSAVLSGVVKTLIGTSQKLYYVNGQTLTNITPLDTATVAAANSLATDYGTLALNPITTVNGSTTLTIADANAPKYAVNDVVTLSGAAGVGGVPNTDINAAHVIRSVGASSYTIRVATAATSAATGGGAAVVRATGRITVTSATHGQNDGDRVKINAAANTGGILAASINIEFIIRNVTINTFDIFTAGTATSSVSASGGASTTYQVELADGSVNQSFGQGYGMGKYGVGKYGVSKSSTTGIVYPRIWFFDRFSETVLMTAGNQTGLYQWTGTTTTAPTLVSGAPTAINYQFVSDNIVVTFGAGGVLNRIFSSDQGDPTNWTASSTNQVFDDDIEGASQLISHVPAAGVNLIFTQQQTYIFQYIGLPLVWSIQLLDNSAGIIAPMARCSVNNVAYWMGRDNFYRWRGADVETIPANSQAQCTALNYVFNDINQNQSYKAFAWFNSFYNEVWFHYPSASSNECDRVVTVSLDDNNWMPHTFDRTCAEYPNNSLINPRLISSDGTLYIHEYGTDADNEAMAWTLTSNLIGRKSGSKKTLLISGFVPDSVSFGSINFNVNTYQYPQSQNTVFSKNYTVTPTTEKVDIQVGGRYWKYTWSGATIGQNWIMGNWMEALQESAEQ